LAALGAAAAPQETHLKLCLEDLVYFCSLLESWRGEEWESLFVDDIAFVFLNQQRTKTVHEKPILDHKYNKIMKKYIHFMSDVCSSINNR